jgi:hypothetical protein
MMRVLLIAALLAVTASCGAYHFPPGTSGQTGTVSGTVRVYPCSPVEQADQPCKGLLGTGMQIVFSNGSDTRTTTVDSGGAYSIELAAGTWKVSFKGIARIISGPPSVTVPAGGSVQADYTIDSGIRAPGPAAAAS